MLTSANSLLPMASGNKISCEILAFAGNEGVISLAYLAHGRLAPVVEAYLLRCFDGVLIKNNWLL